MIGIVKTHTETVDNLADLRALLAANISLFFVTDSGKEYTLNGDVLAFERGLSYLPEGNHETTCGLIHSNGHGRITAYV